MSTRHEQNWAPCRLDTTTLVTTGHRRTMHHCNCAPVAIRHACKLDTVATRNGYNSTRLQLDTIATRHDCNSTRLQLDTVATRHDCDLTWLQLDKVATRHHSYCLCIRIQNDATTSRLLLKSALTTKTILFCSQCTFELMNFIQNSIESLLFALNLD